ncbi:hypothetical protein CYMTET_47716 [Cymbomonas tetramitiformis]|uniref:Uncharacterized protein n=1 Tax=Cymbomonas tetramitiformis TaxID=36881 RepID=A0AAE0EWE2_9CHLO|nr:hypothetical protein CYMTET_47716 [Cymbomonas tetramitiformis]
MSFGMPVTGDASSNPPASGHTLSPNASVNTFDAFKKSMKTVHRCDLKACKAIDGAPTQFRTLYEKGDDAVYLNTRRSKDNSSENMLHDLLLATYPDLGTARVLQFKGWGSGMVKANYRALCNRRQFDIELDVDDVDFDQDVAACVLSTLEGIQELGTFVSHNKVIVQWDGDGYFDDKDQRYGNYTAGLLGVLKYLLAAEASIIGIVITKLITKPEKEVDMASLSYAPTLFDQKMVKRMCMALPESRDSVPVTVITFSQPDIMMRLSKFLNASYSPETQLIVAEHGKYRLDDGFSGAQMNRIFKNMDTMCLMFGGGAVLEKELLTYQYHPRTSVIALGVDRSTSTPGGVFNKLKTTAMLYKRVVNMVQESDIEYFSLDASQLETMYNRLNPTQRFVHA